MPNQPPPHKKNVSQSVRRASTRFSKPKSVNDLLSKSPVLRQVVHAASEQQQWLQWLHQQLEPALAAHVHGTVLRGNELIVYCDAAVWSQRLGYALQALLPQIRARAGGAGADLQARARVQPRPR